jgi:Myelin proteolipid protein (PLP or lipophilin)
MHRLEPMQLVFVIGGASMAAIGLMILFLGCLTTGATRYKVYRAWGSRVGGRVSCAVFMVITYLLQLVWLAMLIFLVIVTIMYTMFWALCEDKSKHPEIECINFEQFRKIVFLD